MNKNGNGYTNYRKAKPSEFSSYNLEKIKEMAETHGIGEKIMQGLLYEEHGKLTLSARGILTLVLNSKVYGGHIIGLHDSGAWCTMWRQGAGTDDRTTLSFDLSDAETAGLMKKKTWVQFPKQMCVARVISFCARSVFPDVFFGLYDEHEVATFDCEPVAKEGGEPPEFTAIEAEKPKPRNQLGAVPVPDAEPTMSRKPPKKKIKTEVKDESRAMVV